MSKRKQKWEVLLNDFLFMKQAEGRSETTIKDYDFHVKLFFNRFPSALKSDKELRKSVYKHLAEATNKSATTFNIRREYLHSFCNWLVTEGVIKQNPVSGIPKKKNEGKIRNIEPETLKKLLALPDLKTFSGLRDYALFLTTLDTGVRPQEAFSILPDDVNLNSLEITIKAKTAKTRVARTLPISPATAKAINRLLNVRPEEWTNDVPVFCTYLGTKMNRKAWAYRMNQYSKKLGVKIRPYDLRHTFALLYLQGGGHAFSLQRTLGHTNLHMTRRYVAVNESELKRCHEKASPVSKLLPTKKRVRKLF